MSDQLVTMNGNADPMWALVRRAIDEHASRAIARYEKLWAYYRNPIELVRSSGLAGDGQRGWYRSAQEVGLPARIIGFGDVVFGNERGRREVVIENDIGWRVGTMVDFMFGAPIRIESLAEDEKTREEIEEVLESVWEQSGGIALLQDMATLGHVFGHVDLLMRVDETNLVGSKVWDAHRWIGIEPIDARRGVAVMNASDYRVIDGYAIHACRETGGVREKLEITNEVKTEVVTEVFTADGWARFVNGERIDGHEWSVCDALPVVHIQNLSQPFVYGGIGEVEALVGLQDELNTRLSDRASRVTMQSFKMYLAKGVEGFGGGGVGPGMVWSTDNPDASIHSFGGDSSSPSEDAHIGEIREAMDKISGVPPVAGGVVRAKLGNLSSATALRITLMSLIAKTMRKRVGYGRGIEEMCVKVLEVLDSSGVLKTSVRDRGVRVVWGGLPVIDDVESRVSAGQSLVELGVERDDVLDDLGFGEADPGVV